MAACAMATGNWTTGKVQTGTIETIGEIKSFLTATKPHPYPENGALLPTPQVTDSGVVGNATFAEIAAAAVAAINTIAAIDIARKQHAIAKDYLGLARQKWDRFRTRFAPCERREMDEACNTPEYDPQYLRRGADYAQEVDKAYNIARRQLGDLTGVHCLPLDDSILRDVEFARSQMRGDSRNYAYRREEHRKDALDDIRWNRRSQALNRGRDIQGQAAKYASAAADLYSSLGGKIGEAAEGAITAIGYFANRNRTTYPERNYLNQPSASEIGYGFSNAAVGTGTSVNGFLTQGSSELYGYSNSSTTYSTNSAISTVVGVQKAGGA